MEKNKFKIGVVMYTYNRIDDARINMEIIRKVWSKKDLLNDVKIVHSYNGPKDLWPEKYLEDSIVYSDNIGHFAGAAMLMDNGFNAIKNDFPDTDYVIVLASDTWLVSPDYIENLINKMKSGEKYLSTCIWGSKKNKHLFGEKGFALDFYVYDFKWAVKSELFPIKFLDFRDKFEDLFFYQNKTVFLEKVFKVRYLQAIRRSVDIPSDNILTPIAETYIERMTEREPVHIGRDEGFLFMKPYSIRKMYNKKMGLITHHRPEEKRDVLNEWDLDLGDHGEKFKRSIDLNYFNNGLDRNTFNKNGKIINYGD